MATLHQQLRASSDGHEDVLDAINRLEEAVCDVYRDAESEAYAGQLQPWALALKVKGRIADVVAEFGDRLNACRQGPTAVVVQLRKPEDDEPLTLAEGA